MTRQKKQQSPFDNPTIEDILNKDWWEAQTEKNILDEEVEDIDLIAFHIERRNQNKRDLANDQYNGFTET